MTHTGHTPKQITELICEKIGENPVFRFFYTFGDDPVEMIMQMYVDRGYLVRKQTYDTPSTEYGHKDMAAFLEAFAYRFYEAAKATGKESAS